jgi:hypothetical protein
MAKKSGKKWDAIEKLRIVTEAARLNDEELGLLLRREGVHEAKLAEWRAAAVAALEEVPRTSSGSKSESKRVKELERELRRKDAALAETAALIVLKKKAEALWGGEDDATASRSGRKP